MKSSFLGEMWIGVCLSVLVELVPEKLRITGVGVYFFIISNIGGNMSLLVPPTQRALESLFDIGVDEALRGNFKFVFHIAILFDR